MEKINILSNSSEPFRDRKEAGQKLGQVLSKYKFKDAVTLGIPRGGIIIAREISRILNCALDIVLTHKIGAPYNPEYAIGAVSENEKIFIGEKTFSLEDIDDVYIKREIEHQLSRIRQRASSYRKILPKKELKGKTVIITDDGIATGATMLAALISAREENPEKLIAALPVSPNDSVKKIASYCDEIIVLKVPIFFGAVGAFYINFEQVSDEEVLETLKSAA